MADQQGELEMELEDEFHEGELENEGEAGLEGEGLGALGNIAGSLLGESEYEAELEDESEDEYEDEAGLEGEGWLGALGNIAGSLRDPPAVARLLNKIHRGLRSVFLHPQATIIAVNLFFVTKSELNPAFALLRAHSCFA